MYHLLEKTKIGTSCFDLWIFRCFGSNSSFSLKFVVFSLKLLFFSQIVVFFSNLLFEDFQVCRQDVVSPLHLLPGVNV